MSLIDEMMEPCNIMNKTQESDGEGGTYTTWTEGPEIQAAIVMDSSITARRAEQEGVTSVYTITTKKENPLAYHDVIKRKDGAFFRVTSEANKSPKVSTLNMHQVTAERWELTS